MFDRVRTTVHRAITSPIGNDYLVVRVPKDIALRVNALLGHPLCSRAELDRRRAGREKLADLRRRRSADASTHPSSDRGTVTPTLRAPVTVYFERDRNARSLGRIREMLDAQTIAYTLVDITDDEVTKDFVLREAKCQLDELPIVFVATTPVGGYAELVDWDVSGRLAKALAGD